MGKRIRLAGFLCLAVLIGACDAEQPQQPGGRNAQVRLTTQASVPVYEVWERYVDADGDGVPDQFDPFGNPIDPPVQVQCVRSYDRGTGEPRTVSANSVPWRHSFDIRILKAGETESVRISTDEAESDLFNLTPYDSTVVPGQNPLPCAAPEVCTPLGRLTAANRIVMESDYEDASRSIVILGQTIRVDEDGRPVFRCPGSSLGEPVLGGTFEDPSPPPFRFDLSPGDTVIVRARKTELAQGGLVLRSPPLLSAAIFVGGQDVSSATAGTTQSTGDAGAGVSFSYTLR